jgi:hypothetical protein
MNKKIFIALIALSFATVVCTTQSASIATGTSDISASVNATLTALAVGGPTATATLSTTPMSSFPTGLITGTLTYPADAMPPERVVAWSTTDSSHYSVDTVAGQATYELGVPTGTYAVVAYSIGGGGFPNGLAGGYSQAVPCGLTASCTDHTLMPVTVDADVTLTNINPGDWYADAGTFPPMPSP